MIDLWLPPKPAIIRPHIEKASFLPGMFPAGAAAAIASSFPIVQATNSGFTSSSASSYAAPLPASIQAGELLLLFVATNNTVTHTTPSGWSLGFTQSSSGARLSCFYKVASGSEGSSVTVSYSGSCHSSINSYRISGYQGTPEVGTAATGTSTSPNPPNLAPSWGSAKTLWFAAIGLQVNLSAVTTTPPSGYGSEVIAGTATLTPRAASSRRELQASSEDPGTYAITQSIPWVANTVAIRPA